MRVNWVAYGSIESADGRMDSQIASARYRVIQPMVGLVKRGHAASLVQIGTNSKPDEVLRRLDGDVVVFSKLMTSDRDDFAKLSSMTQMAIDSLHHTGRMVVADLCDHHFDHPDYGGYYRDFVNRVDAVVVSTPELSALVSWLTERPIFVVSDPFEGPRGEPRIQVPARRRNGWYSRWFGNHKNDDGEPLRLVWFGHQSNWNTMRDTAKSLLKLRDWRIELEILTAAGYGVERFCEEFNAAHAHACCLRFSPWSLAATWEGLARASIVIIPSWPDAPAKQVKGPNRLVESLRAGRCVVANPLPAYQSMAQYCWLGDSIVAGLAWVLKHSEEAQRRTLDGQAFVSSTYSPDVIASVWETVFRNLPGKCDWQARGRSGAGA